jgi:chaperonin cofactor prefoldin
LKDTLEKEVKVLRNQITEKQEIVRTMEEKEIVLSSQLAVFEKQKGNFDRDISLIKKKEKELESLNEAQARRYK